MTSTMITTSESQSWLATKANRMIGMAAAIDAWGR